MPLILALFMFLAPAIFAPIAAHATEAQAAPLQPMPQTAPEPPACRDFRNRKVVWMEMLNLGDAGRAQYIGGAPTILVDPVLMRGLPASLRTFFQLHECAHHKLGHLWAPTTDSEKQADCWAVKKERDQMGLTAADIDGWQPYFVGNRGSSMGHLPGPERVAFLMHCFADPED